MAVEALEIEKELPQAAPVPDEEDDDVLIIEKEDLPAKPAVAPLKKVLPPKPAAAPPAPKEDLPPKPTTAPPAPKEAPPVITCAAEEPKPAKKTSPIARHKQTDDDILEDPFAVPIVTCAAEEPKPSQPRKPVAAVPLPTLPKKKKNAMPSPVITCAAEEPKRPVPRGGKVHRLQQLEKEKEEKEREENEEPDEDSSSDTSSSSSSSDEETQPTKGKKRSRAPQQDSPKKKRARTSKMKKPVANVPPLVTHEWLTFRAVSYFAKPKPCGKCKSCKRPDCGQCETCTANLKRKSDNKHTRSARCTKRRCECHPGLGLSKSEKAGLVTEYQNKLLDAENALTAYEEEKRALDANWDEELAESDPEYHRLLLEEFRIEGGLCELSNAEKKSRVHERFRFAFNYLAKVVEHAQEISKHPCFGTDRVMYYYTEQHMLNIVEQYLRVLSPVGRYDDLRNLLDADDRTWTDFNHGGEKDLEVSQLEEERAKENRRLHKLNDPDAPQAADPKTTEKKAEDEKL